jgi:hypothetical protein
MDLQDVSSKVEQAHGILDKFVAATSLSALVLSFLFGYPIKSRVKNDADATWLCRIACVLSTGLMAGLMWPPMDWRIKLGWCLCLAVTSPSLWWVVTHVALAKFPETAEKLKLKRVSLDTDFTGENDVRPAEPSSNTP